MRETFTTVYRKLARYRKRCRQCNTLIQDGQSATFWKVIRTRTTSYNNQVKKVSWLPFHESCFDQMIQSDGSDS